MCDDSTCIDFYFPVEILSFSWGNHFSLAEVMLKMWVIAENAPPQAVTARATSQASSPHTTVCRAARSMKRTSCAWMLNWLQNPQCARGEEGKGASGVVSCMHARAVCVCVCLCGCECFVHVCVCRCVCMFMQGSKQLEV